MIFACPTRHALGSLFQPHMWLSDEVSTAQKPRSMRRRTHSAEGDNRAPSASSVQDAVRAEFQPCRAGWHSSMAFASLACRLTLSGSR
jgi:hypothetical protein